MLGTTAPMQLDNLGQMAQKIADLQTALQTRAPGYERLLHEIHVGMQKDPDVVHLLTDEQVGVVVAGLSKKKNVVIAEPDKIAKKRTLANGKPLSEATLDDI